MSLSQSAEDMSGRQVYTGTQLGRPGSKPPPFSVARPTSRLVVVNSPSRSVKSNGGTGGRRVYVGNLSWEVTWKDLKDCLRQAGEVVHADVLVNDSGRSKGFGVVEFRDAEGAQRAISNLNGVALMGREMFIREDKDDGRAPSGGAALAGSNRVYVGNLTYEVQWQQLKDVMRQAGHVLHADILTDNKTGRSRGCGLVEFVSTAEAGKAISMLNDTELMGRKMYVREDREGPGANVAPVDEPRYIGGSGGGRNSRVYVGNLAFEVAWQDLKDFIRNQGLDVKTVDVLTGPDGRSKGCALVEFMDGSSAQQAIHRLNNVDFMGRQMFVREDREAPGAVSAPAMGGSGGGRNSRVYVGNLAFEVAWQDLKDFIRNQGLDVKTVDVLTGPDGRSKGCALVEFMDGSSAQQAIHRLNNVDFMGRQMFVREDREETNKIRIDR